MISVAVPPHQLLVYDASGRDVAGAVGPLQEGDNLVLTCEVRGGELINLKFSFCTARGTEDEDLVICDVVSQRIINHNDNTTHYEDEVQGGVDGKNVKSFLPHRIHRTRQV